MAKSIYTKDERKAQFIKIAIGHAKKNGLAKVSMAAVAAEAKVTAPLVFHIFGNRDAFRKLVGTEAKRQGVTLEVKTAPAKKAVAKPKPAKVAKPKPAKVAKPKPAKVAKPKPAKVAKVAKVAAKKVAPKPAKVAKPKPAKAAKPKAAKPAASESGAATPTAKFVTITPPTNGS